MTALRIETLTGAAIGPVLPELARLRTAVFRAWPYLYEGDGRYEGSYLQAYQRCPQAAVVVAFDGDTAVGASTCLPLADEPANVTAPFRERGLDPARFFYFGSRCCSPPIVAGARASPSSRLGKLMRGAYRMRRSPAFAPSSGRRLTRPARPGMCRSTNSGAIAVSTPTPT